MEGTKWSYLKPILYSSILQDILKPGYESTWQKR